MALCFKEFHYIASLTVITINILFYNKSHHTLLFSTTKPFGSNPSLTVVLFRYYTTVLRLQAAYSSKPYMRHSGDRADVAYEWRNIKAHRHWQVSMSIIFKVDMSYYQVDLWVPRLSKTFSWKNRVHWAKTAGQLTFLHRPYWPCNFPE